MTAFVHLPGQVAYTDAHQLQQAVLAARIAGTIPDTVLLLEHAPTITVGRTRGADDNVLKPGDTPVVRVERGGDVTWHGPGQLVAYPIIHLEERRADLHLHMRSLEQAIIDVLGRYGLSGVRDDRNTGVWLPSAPLPRKVCSVGIACRRWVTWHGLALNVDADLGAFERIHPCGFEASIMTRMADHLDVCPSVSELVPVVAAALAASLEIQEGELIHPSSTAITDVLDHITAGA